MFERKTTKKNHYWLSKMESLPVVVDFILFFIVFSSCYGSKYLFMVQSSHMLYLQDKPRES